MPNLQRLAASLLLLPFVAGCLPGVTWMPDSSGFVYTDGKDFRQLMFWDAKTHKSSVLVKDTGAPTFWPAVSPGGKWIVVAKAEDKSLELIFYDRAGREKKRLRKVPWHPWPDKNNFLTPERTLPALFWSPTGDKILVNAWFEASGMYDVKTEKLELLKGSPLIIGHSPFHPDGKGFLILGPSRNEEEAFFWRDLRGRETELGDLKKLMKGLEEASASISQNIMFAAPFLCESWWEPERAYSRWGNQRVHFNLRPHSVSIDKIEPNRARDGKAVHNQFEFRKTRVQVRVIDDDDAALPALMLMRVDVHRPKAKTADVLISECMGCFLIPSPNKAFVTICSILNHPDAPAHRRFIVINQGGQVVADIGPPPKNKKKQDLP